MKRSDLASIRDTAMRCISENITHGFNTRTPNIYGFTDRWKSYGTSHFDVPISERRDPKKYL